MLPTFDIPDSLKEQCFRYLSQNLKLLKGAVLPREVCEQFLYFHHICGKPIDNRVAEIFSDPLKTPVRSLYLRYCTLDDDGLRLFLNHGLTHLHISQCPNLTKETIDNIRRYRGRVTELTIGDYDALVQHDAYFPSKLHLPNIKKLEIFYFLIPEDVKDGFNEIIERSPKLTHLSLISPNRLGELSCLKTLSLTSLVLHRVNLINANVHNTIIEIPTLTHLDISATGGIEGHYTDPNEILSKIVESLPNLVSLDISGTNLAGRGVAKGDIKRTDIIGLKSRVNRPFEFLGLYDTSHEACRRHHIPALQISGDADEKQIITAARRYIDRHEILTKVLNDIYNLCRFDNCNDVDLMLEIILDAMNRHRKEKLIQICGSATLFYIVKSKDKNPLPIKVRRKIIFTLLNGMFAFRRDDFMLRNGCLTLCQFKIPHDMMFEYERLVEILLFTVKEMQEQLFIQRIAIYLLNSLACQVDGVHKNILGDAGVIGSMLFLIEDRLTRRECDDVMEVAWSTLWNVTDETAANCLRFLDGNGMEYFLECLSAFPEKGELLRNIMGLLGNVAEVDQLRPRLMTDDFVSVFAGLLQSDSDGIEVSYNAAGVLAHMCSDGVEAWTIAEPPRELVLSKMQTAINRWDLMAERNINYRSFEPILGLLAASHTPQCQHWAVWALANLTCVYPNKYCSLVEEEGGLKILSELVVSSQEPYPTIHELAEVVINNCQRFKQKDYNGVKLDG